MSTTALTVRQARFIELYLISLNATAAYKEVYGCTQKAAESCGARLIGNAKVHAAIQAARAARSQRLEIKADTIARELWELFTVDVNELVEYRRACCRHCYGEGHEYQLTQREMDKRQADAEVAWEKRKNKKPTDVFTFDELGGVGFDARKMPNPHCPECFGEGHGYAHFKDSRHLSPAARRLYAGVKIGKDGTEMKVLDRFTALAKLGEHLGMFRPQAEAPENEETRARRIRAELDAMDASVQTAAA